jgi:type II secretory pathway pseudopilin PulG
MRRARAFTLIEIAISVFILMILMLLAIPSVSGVLADRRLQRSLDAMNQMVRQAQDKSVHERRSYLLVWQKDGIILRPEAFSPDEAKTPAASLALERGQAFLVRFPAALKNEHAAEWIFWPSGACEPANIRFKGPSGSWEVNYSPLTARPAIVRYATK